MLNYMCQFFKIGIVFIHFISETKSVTPNFFCIPDTSSNSLFECSKSFFLRKSRSTGKFLPECPESNELL